MPEETQGSVAPEATTEEAVSNPLTNANLDAGKSTDWHTGLPETFRENQNFTKYKTADDFYNSHLNLVSKLGEKAPSAPEKFEDYKYDLGEDYKLPEGYEINDDYLKGVKESFQKNNIPQEAFNDIVSSVIKAEANEYQNTITEQQNAAKAEDEAREAFFKEKLGADYGNYNKNIGDIFDKFANNEDREDLKKMTNPERYALGNLLNNIAKSSREGSIPSSQSNMSDAGSISSQVKSVRQQLSEMPRYSPERQGLNDRLNSLYIQASEQGVLDQI